MADPCLLIGDIGGTNARFALADPEHNAFSAELSLRCDQHATAEQALDVFLQRSGAPEPDVICLAAAGPVVDRRVRFLNNPWQIDAGQLEQRFPGAVVQLINDFEAVARSIPVLDEADIAVIGPRLPERHTSAHYTTAVLGPGTGLGVAGLLVRDGQSYPVVGEGGHLGFAPENPLQFEVLTQLRQRFERVSNERLLSGPGLENIYRALCSIHGTDNGGGLSAEQIFKRAGTDDLAAATVQLFFEALGQVAGSLALTLGANDGVYVAGGIVQRYPELLMDSDFRAGFENKGRHRSLMERIPTLLVTHPQAGLLGASAFARQMCRQRSEA